MSRGSNYRFPRAGVSGVSGSMFPRNILKFCFYFFFIFHGLFNILDGRKVNVLQPLKVELIFLVVA